MFTDELPHEKHFLTNMILRLGIIQSSLVLLHVSSLSLIHYSVPELSTASPKRERCIGFSVPDVIKSSANNPFVVFLWCDKIRQ